MLDRLSQLVTHAQRARTDAILNWEESKERWAKQSEANEASRKARAVEKERKKQENLAREEERRRQKREENAAKAQGKTAEALVQREASTGKAKSSSAFIFLLHFLTSTHSTLSYRISGGSPPYHHPPRPRQPHRQGQQRQIRHSRPVDGVRDVVGSDEGVAGGVAVA